jgi:hypothetical protein
VPSGAPKDHQFVSNVLSNVGLGFDGDIDKHPTADDWANPKSYIPGFKTVDGPPQAGDILATAKPIQTDWYYGGGQQMGIASGQGSSIGIVNNMRIGENDFGHQDGHDPTIWRSNVVSEMGSPVGNDLNKSPQQEQEENCEKWMTRGLGVAGGAIGRKTIIGPSAGSLGGMFIGDQIGPRICPKIGDTFTRPNPIIPPGTPGSPGTPGNTD